MGKCKKVKIVKQIFKRCRKKRRTAKRNVKLRGEGKDGGGKKKKKTRKVFEVAVDRWLKTGW